MSRVTTRRPMRRITATGEISRPDTLAVEEPLELRVNGSPLTVTMRTPGADVDLAHGFLLSENIIGSAADIVSARYCAGATHEGQNTYNVLDVQLRTQVPIAARNYLTSSACGVCGTATLEQVEATTRYPIPADAARIDAAVLAALPDELRSHQKVFDVTGGLHAAALCDGAGEVLVVREDVGRHNAVDKVIGWALGQGRIPAHDLVLIVSSRASFEIVQKAAMAGIPVLGAVSAPSSLAVDLAQRAGITLAAFMRGDTMNLYTHSERVLTTQPVG